MRQKEVVSVYLKQNVDLVCEDVRSGAGFAQVLGAMTQEIRSTMAGKMYKVSSIY